jgi:hypothetical protein
MVDISNVTEFGLNGSTAIRVVGSLGVMAVAGILFWTAKQLRAVGALRQRLEALESAVIAVNTPPTLPKKSHKKRAKRAANHKADQTATSQAD